MRIIHTSDWHIGHRLYGRSRLAEYACFLDWMASYIEDNDVEALLISGDIFDTTSPGNRSQALYYDFLHRISCSCCRHVVIISGNHDSPSLLEAPGMLLKRQHIHVVGRPAETAEAQIISLTGADGLPEVLVCAAPFLRDRDIRVAEAGESIEEKADKLQQGILAHYQQLCRAAAEIQQQAGQALPIIAMGHLLTTGASMQSGDNVRELYIGGLGRLEASLFPANIDYFALGHIHLPQKVGGMEHIRYSGSPLAMGFNEINQQKMLLQIQCSGEGMAIEPVPVPVFQQMAVLQGELPELLSGIAAFAEEAKDGKEIWLELRYEGSMDAHRLREQLNDAVVGSGLVIVGIRTRRTAEAGLQSDEPELSLDELDVHEVFGRRLDMSDYSPELCEELRHAFTEVYQSLQQDDPGEES